MADTRKKVEGKFLEYLDKPLVREGNTICYGDMNEKCILVLEIMSYKEVEGKIAANRFSQFYTAASRGFFQQ